MILTQWGKKVKGEIIKDGERKLHNDKTVFAIVLNKHDFCHTCSALVNTTTGIKLMKS